MFRKYVLPVLSRIIITLLSKTLRWNIYNSDIVEKIKKTDANVIFSFWHGRQFLLVYSHRNRGICIMTSLSKDGDLQTDILRGFGYNVVRGSSTRGGARAVVEMLRIINKGQDVAFTVDGPRGPIYKAKPGVVFLAAKTNRVIIPVATSAQKFWTLNKTWDKYVIPKPFSSVGVMYGEPIYVSANDNIDEKTQEVEDAINRVTSELDSRVERK